MVLIIVAKSLCYCAKPILPQSKRTLFFTCKKRKKNKEAKPLFIRLISLQAQLSIDPNILTIMSAKRWKKCPQRDLNC